MSVTLTHPITSKEVSQQPAFVGLKNLRELREFDMTCNELAVVHLSTFNIDVTLWATIVADNAFKKKEAITLKDGVVYLDHVGQKPLKQLEGKHVFRLSPCGGDRSYMDTCIKIIHVSSIGEILYEHNDYFLREERKIRFLSPRWNDGEWAPVTPAINGRAFFENICTVMAPSSQRKALTLVNTIFTKLNEDCHLPEKAPFAFLRDYCIRRNKGDLLKEIDAFERLIGPLSVKILSNQSKL